jgi:hypothetical protein
MKLWVHERLYGVRNVFRGEWGAVRKAQSAAEVKGYSSAFLANFPGNRQPSLEGLGLPIQADQNATG